MPLFSLPKLARDARLATLLLLLICASMFLPGLGTALVARQQELRVLLASRTMAEGGSWLVPQFMGQERLRKPPLMYWLVASAFQSTGSTENVTAARAVSAVSATALVLAIFLRGRRLVGRQAAFLGALTLVTSLGFMRHARLAETDIPQATFCSLAIFSLYAALTGRSGNFRHWALAGVFAGLGFMIKGPASIALPVAAVCSFLLAGAVWARRRGEGNPPAARPPPAAGRRFGPVAAVLIFAAIAAPWYIAVSAQAPAGTGAQAGDELSRLLLESRHQGPFFYYVYTLPARLGVWGLLLPVAVWAAWRRWWRHRGPRFVLCWFASSFLVLSALQSKQQHYALLLFAPAALLCGWLLRQAFRNSRAVWPRFARAHVAGLCLLPPAVAAAALASRLAPLPAEWIALRDAALPMLVCCGVVGLAGFLKRGNPLAGILAVAATMVIAMAFQSLQLEKLQSGYSMVPGLFDANRAALRSAPVVFAAGSRGPVFEWYARRDIRVVTNDVAGVWRDAGRGDVLIASERDARTNIVSQIQDRWFARAALLDVAITFYRKGDAPP